MKIARITERYPAQSKEINRGLIPNVHYLSKFQSEMGDQVTIYTVREPGQPAHQREGSVEVVRIKKPPMTRTFMGLRICQAIRKSGQRPDVVHSLNPLPLGWLFSRARKILPAKYVMSVHASIDSRTQIAGWPSPRKLYVQEFRRLAAELARAVDLVLPVSRFIRKELMATGVDPRMMRVIPSGVETDLFTPRELRSGEARSILYVGRFSSGKGIPHLLHAFHVLERRHDLKLTLAGGTTEDDGYREVLSEIARLGLGKNVEIRPPVPHTMLPELYRSSDIVVLPSDKEALGKVLLEAMACSVPVIASSSGGVADIVDDGKTGILVPCRDARSLADALDLLIRDDRLRRRMGLAARRKAEEFDWKIVARRYTEAFESVCGRGG